MELLTRAGRLRVQCSCAALLIKHLVPLPHQPVALTSAGVLRSAMARKHSKHGPYEDLQPKDEAPATSVLFWLCGRSTGKTIIWHHPVPKSRGGTDVVPMHAICQQTLIANFSNSELQRHGMDVNALLADPNVRKFVDWVAKKDPDFTATTAKKQR